MVTREEYLEAKTLLNQLKAVTSDLPEGVKLGSAWVYCKLDCEIVILKWQLTIKEKKLKGMKRKS